MSINKIKIAIFDFDGVICDSVSVKTNAFLELYNDFDQNKLEIVKRYHLDNGGISRYEKIKYFEKFFFNRTISEEKLKSMANHFSNLVVQKVVESKFLPGVINFIKTCKKNNILTFVCTGTPQNEILDITKKQGISNLFDGIYGSPLTKQVIIKKIIKKYNILNSECVFFGDAMTDYNAANDTGILFYGLKNSDTEFPTNTKLIPHFKNFSIN
jgi:beta-phosphoglucomutase-like phosphatase (HAD superfamily)